MTTSFRRAMAVGAAVVLAAGPAMLSVPTAIADTVRVDFECAGYMVPKHKRAYTITITAPATASPGATVTLGASIRSAPQTGAAAALDFPAHAAMKILLSGAASGEIWAQDFVYPDGSTDIVGGRATATLPNPGTVTFRPLYWLIPGYNCIATEPIPVVATTQVR